MTCFKLWTLLIVAVTVTGCGKRQSVDPADVEPGTKSSSVLSPETPEQSRSKVMLAVEQVSDGRIVDPLADPLAKAVVLVFVITDCPIANRYAPELTRLYHTYQSQGVAFWLVYADPDESIDKIKSHLKEYKHHMPAVRDPDHRLVDFCGATRTPEAAVFTVGGQRHYRGRIDDRFTDYGKSRASASRHELQDAIDAVLAGKPVVSPVVPAIGCYIPGSPQ